MHTMRTGPKLGQSPRSEEEAGENDEDIVSRILTLFAERKDDMDYSPSERERHQAQQLLDQAQAPDACEGVPHQAREEVQHMETLAQSHFDRAVRYVIDRLAGKE